MVCKKYSPKLVHFGCLVLAGIGFLIFPHVENKYFLFPAITGLEFVGQYDGIPYLDGSKQNSKKKDMVCIMGIINMMIVFPCSFKQPLLVLS